MKSYQRIIDANFNRAREGLRVLEEIARFLLDNRDLTERAKRMRHKLYSLLKEGYPYIFARNIKKDVGASLTLKEENKREDHLSIIRANAQRASEALRVIEEFSKLHPHPSIPHLLSSPLEGEEGKERGNVSQAIKALRFQLYSIEKELSILILPSLPDYPLYVIVDPEQRKKNFLSFVKELVKEGAEIIQLRAKSLNDRDFYSLGKKIEKITKGKSSFIVNDRVDLAISLNADGIHLGQDDLPIKEAKKIFPGRIIGISCHNRNEILVAKKENVSYISIGPIFATRIKKDRKPVGLELIKKARKELNLPIVAIGGINEENIREVFKAGADYAAVISAIAESKEPGKKLRRLVRKAKNGIATSST